MVSRTVLAIAIAAWTLLSWGGRLRLLTSADHDIANWLRIGGSLLLGAVAVLALLLAAGGALERWVLTLFGVWTAVIWVRSLFSVWTGDHSLGFQLVHTVLAIGFFALVYLSMRTAWSTSAA